MTHEPVLARTRDLIRISRERVRDVRAFQKYDVELLEDTNLRIMESEVDIKQTDALIASYEPIKLY
jgi:hypothetical protein